jgi:hypothetical protein
MDRTGPLSERRTSLRAELEAVDSLDTGLASVDTALSGCRNTLAHHPRLAADFAAELRAMVERFLAGFTHPGPKETETGVNGSAAEDSIAKTPTPTLPAEDESGSGQSAFDRMVTFLHSRQNHPATVAEFVEATGATPDTVRQILYKRRKSSFHGDKRSGIVHWRLANDTPLRHVQEQPSEDDPGEHLMKEDPAEWLMKMGQGEV